MLLALLTICAPRGAEADAAQPGESDPSGPRPAAGVRRAMLAVPPGYSPNPQLCFASSALCGASLAVACQAQECKLMTGPKVTCAGKYVCIPPLKEQPTDSSANAGFTAGPRPQPPARGAPSRGACAATLLIARCRCGLQAWRGASWRAA